MKFFTFEIYLCIYTFFIFQVHTSTLDQIPNAYISDSSFISMTLIAQAPSGKLYAAPKGHGSACTLTSPCALKTAIDKLKPGYYLYLKEGTYNANDKIYLTKSGTKNKYIVITSVPGEKKPIISSQCNKGSGSCSEIALFKVKENASYIIIENIIFKDAIGKTVYGVGLSDGGQNHIIIRNCVFDSLKTTKNKDEKYNASGIALIGEKSVIKNIMIYKNTLTNNVLGYSEAISIMGNCENIYVLNNTLNNNTNIGIDFNGNTGDCETSSLDQPRNSVAMYNSVTKSICSYDVGAGIYADGAKNILIYGNTVTKSDCGIEVGAEEKESKNPITNIIVENNKLINNTAGIKVGGYDKERYFVKNTLFKNNIISNGENSIIITKSDNITFVGNKISGAKTYFVEMEEDIPTSDIKNIKFEKNSFSGKGKFYIYRKELTLKQFVEKYTTNTIK